MLPIIIINRANEELKNVLNQFGTFYMIHLKFQKLILNIVR